jgi:transposase-like protein
VNNKKCNICGAKMKKNGFTKAGVQRWRCTSCGASSVVKNNTDARWLKSLKVSLATNSRAKWDNNT